MKIQDLELSDSTKGFLKKNKITVDQLVEHRDDPTEIKGIGPARAKEIQSALAKAEGGGEDEDFFLDEVGEAPKEELAPADRRKEGGSAPAPFAESREKPPAIEDLVRYQDPSGKVDMARVTAIREDGSLDLTVFTGAGGQYQERAVARHTGHGRVGGWLPAEKG